MRPSQVSNADLKNGRYEQKDSSALVPSTLFVTKYTHFIWYLQECVKLHVRGWGGGGELVAGMPPPLPLPYSHAHACTPGVNCLVVLEFLALKMNK